MQKLTDWRALHGKSFEGAKALVTGGAGFIGSHLVEALIDLGAAVVVIDDLSGGNTENIAPFKGVEFIEASIMDQSTLDRATKGCRYVFHQAALGSVPGSVEKPRLYFDVDATGTLNVLEAARAAKVQRVMFAASSSAYGNSEELPKTEKIPPQPLSPYAAAKVAAESLLACYSASYGLDTASLRYFNIFGPRQNANSAYAAVIAAFAKAILSGKRPNIYGDGEQSRDFTFVHNAVHANLLAARSEKKINGTVMNVATGKRTTVNELGQLVARHFKREDLQPIHQPERTGDVKHSVADLSRTKSIIGYAPIVNFEPGLAQTLDWYKSTGI